MKIGVIGAMQMEMDALKESLADITTESVSGVDFVCGKLGEIEIVAAVSGIGKVFAAICTEAMILRFQVEMVINIGVAGTLTKGLGVMDVAVADQVVQHDMDTSAIGDPVGLLSGINQIFLPCDAKMCSLMVDCLKEQKRHYLVGTVATGDQFLHDPEVKARIHERFDAIAGEMEGGSIGHVCYMNHVPFLVLRTISDGDGGAMDYQTFAEKAAEAAIAAVLDFIGRAGELRS